MSSKKPEETVGTVPLEKIERAIHLVRRQKVILASDLAELYGVVTWRLHEQVKRNKDRQLINPPDPKLRRIGFRT